MSKVAVIYWTGTGNTQQMANAVAEGAQSSGADVSTFFVDEFDAESIAEYDALAFGCPAMGSEVLEEGSFEPFFSSIEGSLGGKKTGLFGSYGWGDQSWMRDWESRVETDGAVLVSQGVTCMNEPDDTALEECRNLGASLS